MPRIQKSYTLEVTVEQFLNACSDLELQELELLLYSPQYQQRMNKETPTDRTEQKALSGN